MSGRCHVLIAPSLRDKIAGELGRKNGVSILDADDYGDGRLLTRLSIADWPEGEHGFQALILEGDRMTFRAEGVYHEDS